MKTTLLLSASVLCLFAACGTKQTDTGVPPGGGKPIVAEPLEEGHGAPNALGAMTIGAYTFQVTQLGSITPGKEGGVEMEFPAGKPLPNTVRAWVGIETGVGSMKQVCGKEGDRGLHGHVEVPKTLPAGSKIWIEIEENGKAQSASVAWK